MDKERKKSILIETDLLCDYGCGNKANYEQNNGKLCCVDNHNKCPSVKIKNSFSNKGKKKQNYTKINDLEAICKYCGKKAEWLVGYYMNIPCCQNMYCRCPAVISKAVKKNIGKIKARGKNSKLYGRKRPEQSEFMKINNPMFDINVKIKHKNIINTIEYKNNMATIIRNRWDSEEYRKKYSNSLLEKGLKRTDSELGKLKSYYRKVYSYTKKALRKYSKIINPNGKNIGYHIDHIYSVIDGFTNEIDPSIIGNISNLQILKATENLKKHSDSWITINELLERIEEFKYENNF